MGHRKHAVDWVDYKQWRREADALLEMVGPRGSVSSKDFERALKELDLAKSNYEAAWRDVIRYRSIIDGAGRVLKRIFSATNDLVVDDRNLFR